MGDEELHVYGSGFVTHSNTNPGANGNANSHPDADGNSNTDANSRPNDRRNAGDLT